MPPKVHTKIINVEPRMRERILDSDIEKITGREIPKVHVAGKEPEVFYMETLSQIYIVGKNIKAINEKETEIQESFFPERERIGGIQKQLKF